MSPAERLDLEKELAVILSQNEPIDYFYSGNGARWFLVIAQGIQNTQAYCLAVEGVLGIQ